MSSEQIPKSKEANVPHSREYVAPDALPVQPGISAPDTVREGLEILPPKMHERADWDQKKADVRSSVVTTPEQNNTKRNVFIALGATSAAIALGISTWVGATGNGFIQKPGTLPGSTTETSAPVTPGANPSVSAETTPTPSVEVKPGTAVENFKFYTSEGDEFLTYEDVQKSAELTIEDIPKVKDTINVVVDRMEDVANYAPSEKTVRESLNKPTEQLTIEDFMAVYEQYFDANAKTMFSPASGDLYDTMKTICMQTAFSRLMSINIGEKVPYAVTFTLHTNETGLLIADNSIHNEVDDNTFDYLGDHRLMSSGGDDVIEDNGKRYLSGRMELIKKSAN